MRRYFISFMCLLVIAGLLILLLRPWSGGKSQDWPDIPEEEINLLEFSGGQNYSLEFQKGRWYVRDGVMQSLAAQRKVEYLLEQINQVKPKRELPGPPSDTEATGATEGGFQATNATAGQGGLFGPEFSNNVLLPKPDEYIPEVSILPTSVTLRGANAWTIAPQFYVEEAGLVSTRLIKNGNSKIVYLDPVFTRILSRPSRYYADLNLFSARPERVIRIELFSPGSEIWELAKLNEGTFTFIQPERFKGIEVAQAGMEFYLHVILSTQSPGPLFTEAPTDLAEPFLVVKVMQTIPNLKSGSGREEETLTISRRKSTGDYIGFSSYQGAYFIISAEKVEQLGRSLLSLRSRPVLPNGIGHVQKATLIIWDVHGKKQTREFFRSENGWSELDSTIRLIGVDTVFWRLGTLQTEGGSDGSLPTDITPIIRWQFEYGDGKKPLTLTFYASRMKKNYNWVRVNDEPAYYPVHFGSINEILTLLPAPPSEVKSD